VSAALQPGTCVGFVTLINVESVTWPDRANREAQPPDAPRPICAGREAGRTIRRGRPSHWRATDAIGTVRRARVAQRRHGDCVAPGRVRWAVQRDGRRGMNGVLMTCPKSRSRGRSTDHNGWTLAFGASGQRQPIAELFSVNRATMDREIARARHDPT
jgi:hypothetical protein